MWVNIQEAIKTNLQQDGHVVIIAGQRRNCFECQNNAFVVKSLTFNICSFHAVIYDLNAYYLSIY